MSKQSSLKDLKLWIKETEKEAPSHKPHSKNIQIESENFYQTLINTMTDGLGVMDENGIIIYNNDKLCEMCGYTNDEIIGRPVLELFDETNRNKLIKQISERKKGGKDSYEIVWTHKSGKKIPTIISPQSIYDENGKFKGSFAVVTDISRQKLAENEIRKFKTIADKSNYGVSISGLNGHIIYCNNCFASMHGYTNEELLGKHISIFFSNGKDRQMNNLYDKLIAEGEFTNEEVIHTRKDGSVFPVLLNAQVITDDHYKPLFLSATAIDITGKKLLEAQLIRSERLAATGQLATSIAHEVNSPLQSISNLLHVMKRDCADNEDMLENINLLSSAFGNIHNTVKNLLDLNRPGKEKKQPADVNKIIKSTISLAQSHLNKKKIQLNLDLASELSTINISPQQFGQVIINLINNAVEAISTNQSSNNALKSSSRTNGEISIKTDLINSDLVIKMTDSGSGIPEKDLNKIFDPFYTKKRKLGMGIGLSICNNIIEEYSGTIKAENALNGGAVFTITLPLK